MKNKKYDDSTFGTMLTGGVLGSLAGIGTNEFLRKYYKPKVDNSKVLSPRVGKLWAHMQNKHNLRDIKILKGNLDSFQPKAKQIVLTNLKDISVLAHEAGHAVDFKKFPKLKLFARTRGPLIGTVAGVGLMVNKDEDINKYAPVAVLAGGAPTIYQEGKASLIGLKEINQVFKKPQAIKSLKTLLLPFLGYLSVYAGPAAGMYIANKIRKANKD